jgi:hypothetical protein
LHACSSYSGEEDSEKNIYFTTIEQVFQNHLEENSTSTIFVGGRKEMHAVPFGICNTFNRSPYITESNLIHIAVWSSILFSILK